MQPLQLSDEILLLALLPLCPLPCVLQLAAVARRAGPGQLTTRRPPRTGPHGAHARFAGRPPLPTLPLRARAVAALWRASLGRLRASRRGTARLASTPECGPHVARQLCCTESTNLARRPRTPPGCPIFRGDSEVFLLQWLAVNTDSVAGETMAAFLRRHSWRHLWLSGHYGETTLVLVFAVENCEGALVFPISAAAGDWPDVAAL